MTFRPNIILVGFMGAGKSTVGKLVASRMNRSMVDMDEVIEQRAGKKISDIFSEQGESFFRSMERSLVKELAARENLVVAAGGGVVLNSENIEDFSKTGVVICLTSSPEILLKRVEQETHRPLLEGVEKKRKVVELFNARRHLYEAIPNRIDTTGLLPDAVAEEVIQLYSKVSD